MKLGRKAVKTDSRTLRLARYTATLPPAPATCDWTKGQTSFGLMKNDVLGDCTIAGAGHAIQIWSLNSVGLELTVSDDDILAAYEKWDGYDPTDPSTDNGGIELDVLNNWRKDGLGGHALLAFADPDSQNLDQIRQAIYLFGGVYIGVSLPLTAQDQDVWDFVPSPDGKSKPGSWGGHCVFVTGYDEAGFECITWGVKKKMTIRFWQMYTDEAHALLGVNWMNNQGSPQGFDLATLQADLAGIK